MTNTIPNVPREQLEAALSHPKTPEEMLSKIKAAEELRALLSAQSPACVDGLEVRAYERKWSSDNIKPEKMVNENGRKEWPFKFKLIPVTQMPCLPDDEPLCRLSDAAAIIDGLRGEVELMQHTLRVARLQLYQVAISRDDEQGIEHAIKSIDAALSAGKDSDQ